MSISRARENGLGTPRKVGGRLEHLPQCCPTTGSVAHVVRVGEVEGTEPGPVKLSRTLLE